MNTKDILNKAADLIIEHGHCKGAYTVDGALCLLGALRMAAFGHLRDADHSPAARNYHEAREVLESTIRAEYLDVWNDAPERRRVDVIEALRNAAASLP